MRVSVKQRIAAPVDAAEPCAEPLSATFQSMSLASVLSAHSIRLLDSRGIVSTVAGNCTSLTYGYAGDGGPGTAALLQSPWGLSTDGAGGALWTESGNYVVRRLFANGTIVRVAGNGAPGFSGDGGR